MNNADQADFYDALKLSNMVARQQSNEVLIMALVGRIAKAIENDEDPEKIERLFKLKKELEGE